MHDVLISGGGPVGLGLAIELADRGVDVAVVERSEEPSPIPKGQNLTQRTMEHMQVWGVEEELRAAKTIPKGFGLGGLTAYGSLLSGYHYDWYKRAAVRPYYYTDNERLPQYATEAVLRQRAQSFPNIEIHYGWKTDEAGQDDGSAWLNAKKDEALLELTGRYLVGCDGSRSLIRQSAGMSETCNDHDRLMVLIVFESPEFFKLVEQFADKQFYNVLHPDLDGYWMFFGMVEWGKSFFFHAPVPPGTNRENFDFKALIHRAVGSEFDLDLVSVGFWDLRISVADQYRADRIFIAGDAAHSHPPYGGYGINTGFEDARNLGWKLAAELQGWGGPHLLDSYEAERKPVFESTARDFIDAFIREDRDFVRKFNPEIDLETFEIAWEKRSVGSAAKGVETFAPHYGGSPIVLGGNDARPSAKGIHDFNVRPGHHFPPVELADGMRMQDRLKSGMTFFDFSDDGAFGVQMSVMAKDLKIPLTVIALPESDAAAVYRANYILVRPDHYVAWAGNKKRDPKHILNKTLGNQ